MKSQVSYWAAQAACVFWPLDLAYRSGLCSDKTHILVVNVLAYTCHKAEPVMFLGPAAADLSDFYHACTWVTKCACHYACNNRACNNAGMPASLLAALLLIGNLFHRMDSKSLSAASAHAYYNGVCINVFIILSLILALRHDRVPHWLMRYVPHSCMTHPNWSPTRIEPQQTNWKLKADDTLQQC